MGRKKTHEEYVKEVSQINNNIEVFGQYITNRTPILHRCKIDGYIWPVVPSSVLRGRGCPMCSGNMKRTHEQYLEDLNFINPNIEPIEPYINVDTTILHRCKICEHIWPIKPNHTLSGHGCPMCGFKKCADNKRKFHEEYVRDLHNINQDIEVLGEYINNNTKILHRCKKCNCKWDIDPCHTLRGQGCPVCNESHGERRISQWLDDNDIEYIPQHRFDDCRDKYPLPFDFYLPQYNTCIEYNGKQHYEPIEFFGGQDAFEVRKLHDNIKDCYCKNNHISLIHISYQQDVTEELNKFLLI